MRRIAVISRLRYDGRLINPAIRMWRMVRSVADAGFEVELLCREHDPSAMSYPGVTFTPFTPEAAEKAARRADAVLADPTFHPALAPAVTARPFVIDLSCPPHLESLEGASLWWQYGPNLERTWGLVTAADLLICSNPRQIPFWEGFMSAANRINPANREGDPRFARRIALIPYGMTEHPFPTVDGAVKGILPGIEKEDIVGLWNGAITEWYDPVMAVEALAEVAAQAPRLKLLFTTAGRLPDGSRHPVVQKLEEEARRTGLLGQRVFFLNEWAPQEQWPAYLQDADFGFFSHRDTLETRYASRIRVLELLWRGIPTVLTGGDYYSDLVAEREWGLVTPPGDRQAFASSLLSMANPSLRASFTQRIAKGVSLPSWEEATAPLLAFLNDPCAAADKRPFSSERMETITPLAWPTYDDERLGRIGSVAIFGAGSAMLVALAAAHRRGWEVLYAVDSDPALWGTVCQGVEIFPPETIDERPPDLVIVASQPGASTIAARLESSGRRRGVDYLFHTDPVDRRWRPGL